MNWLIIEQSYIKYLYFWPHKINQRKPQMNKVKLLDKSFVPFIYSHQIEKRVRELALQINQDLAGKKVFFLGILNGAFMFAADLFKSIDLECQITFLKLASYEGTSSTGKVKRLIGINEDIKDHTVVVIEDIVDSGGTLEHIIKQLKGYDPLEIKIVTMFLKPDAYKKDFPLDYVGMEIPDRFIVGYGLDYNGYGRNLKDLHKLDE